MTEKKSIICPSCSEKNNPSFNQCWKCGHWFVSPPPNIPARPPQHEVNRAALTSGLLLSFLGCPLLLRQIHFIVEFSPYICLGILGLVVISPLLVPKEDKESAYDFLKGFFIGFGILILTLIGLCFGTLYSSSFFKWR